MKTQAVIIDRKQLLECGEAAFMASAGWKLRGAWDFLDAEGKNRWVSIAQEVLHTAGFEVHREIEKF